MKPEIYYPVKPFRITQHFADNQACVYDFGKSTQIVMSKLASGLCPIGYEELYPKFGMKGHNGMDIATGEWPLYAAMDGVIVEQQSVPARGLGLGIMSHEKYDFPEGNYYLKLRYWHLKSFNKNAGDTVKVGDLIGVTNNTGYSSGNHLHFEGQLMTKDAGGHPKLVQLDNGYANAVDIEPYFNGKYAVDAGKFIFNKNLCYGMVNSDVLELQKRLATEVGLDYSTGPGIFGPRTLKAVIRYQYANGIYPPIGFVWPITRASLNNT